MGAWLFQVARNASVGWIRKRGREAPYRGEELAEASSLPNPARDELHRVIWGQLARLDADHRDILVLYYFRSKRRREIARLLGISPDAAAKRLQRARDDLAWRLIDALGDDWSAKKHDRSRAARVMGVVSAAPVAWKPSASLALAGAAITRASAAKVVAGLALSAIVVAALAYGGWRYFSRPYSTKDITAASSLRPHRGIGMKNEVLDKEFTPQLEGAIRCKQQLGGIIKSYYREAARSGPRRILRKLPSRRFSLSFVICPLFRLTPQLKSVRGFCSNAIQQ